MSERQQKLRPCVTHSILSFIEHRNPTLPAGSTAKKKKTTTTTGKPKGMLEIKTSPRVLKLLSVDLRILYNHSDNNRQRTERALEKRGFVYVWGGGGGRQKLGVRKGRATEDVTSRCGSDRGEFVPTCPSSSGMSCVPVTDVPFTPRPLFFRCCLSLEVVARISRSGGLRTQKLKSHPLRAQSLKVLPLKPGIGQYIAMHATFTARDFFLANFYPSGPFTCIFFPKPLPSFSCVSCG